MDNKFIKNQRKTVSSSYPPRSSSGARLPIDSPEFIDLILNLDKNVTRIFYMAGIQYYLNCGGAVQFLDSSVNALGYVP